MENQKKMQFYGGTFGACLPLLVFMALMITIAALQKVSLVLFCMAGFAGLCTAFLLAKDKKEFEKAVVAGLKNDTLCVIIFAFLLAGVLSQELRQSGLIQGLTWLVTELGLSAGFLPLVGFIICALISTACGTSNGAIVAVLPVLLPVATTVGANPAVVVGAIVSGAIFGDNLAPISDTTIASALTQGAEVRDVVRTRLPYSLIAGVVSAVLFVIIGFRTSEAVTLPELVDASYAKTLIMLVIPVIMIILMLRGWNLISTLIVCDLVGFVLCLVFGFLDVPTLFSATGPIGAGLTGMLNVICFSFFMFALLEMLKRSGVFDMLLEKLNNASKTPRQAELVTILICFVGSVAIGAASITIVTLLDKPARREKPITADLAGFEVPDEFVVGYGLDYAQQYRNMPYIGVLKPQVYEKVRNIALLGLDTRQDNNVGRSDAIVILTIDKEHNKLKLTSIARDTYVAIEGHSKDKLTHAYAYGKSQLAVKTLNQNFDLEIKDYVTMNFYGLARVIDYIGGVDINVTEAEKMSLIKTFSPKCTLSEWSAPQLKRRARRGLTARRQSAMPEYGILTAMFSAATARKPCLWQCSKKQRVWAL